MYGKAHCFLLELLLLNTAKTGQTENSIMMLRDSEAFGLTHYCVVMILGFEQ